jgi:hypothetical protein
MAVVFNTIVSRGQASFDLASEKFRGMVALVRTVCGGTRSLSG